jgi:hypothetical protein
MIKLKPGSDIRHAVVVVGDGRGFVVETKHGDRLVFTAAHCLPELPEPHPWADRSWRLLAPLGKKPSVVATCLFVDPVGDIAVLGSPGEQEQYEEAEAYEAFIQAATPLSVGSLQSKMFAEFNGWLLSVDGKWFHCAVDYHEDGPLRTRDNLQRIGGGMSGSPIIADNGVAIGLLSYTNDFKEGGPHPRLDTRLPAFVLNDIVIKPIPSRVRESGRSR